MQCIYLVASLVPSPSLLPSPDGLGTRLPCSYHPYIFPTTPTTISTMHPYSTARPILPSTLIHCISHIGEVFFGGSASLASFPGCEVWIVCACIAVCIGFWGSVFWWKCIPSLVPRLHTKSWGVEPGNEASASLHV